MQVQIMSASIEQLKRRADALQPPASPPGQDLPPRYISPENMKRIGAVLEEQGPPPAGWVSKDGVRYISPDGFRQIGDILAAQYAKNREEKREADHERRH